MDYNGTVDELHFVTPGGCKDHDDERKEIDERDAIPTASRQYRRAATELLRFDLETSDVNGYEGDDDDYAYADEGEEVPQADDGSMQTLEN